MIGQILINGILFGGLYAILAVGFSLVFGVANILNMAHTAFYMIACFMTFIVTVNLSLNPLFAIVIALMVVFVVSILAYKLCIDRVKEQDTAVMIITIALAILAQEIFIIFFARHMYGVQPYIKGSVEIFQVGVSYQHLIAIISSIVVLIVVWLLLKKTRLGKSIRAVSQDSEAAGLMGINVSWVCMTVMVISALLAATAGVLTAPIMMVHGMMWLHPLVLVLAIVVLGGLGSIKGSIIAAFILGFAETIVTFAVPWGTFIKGAVSLTVMVLVLIKRPEGLFGVVFEEERL